MANALDDEDDVLNELDTLEAFIALGGNADKSGGVPVQSIIHLFEEMGMEPPSAQLVLKFGEFAHFFGLPIDKRATPPAAPGVGLDKERKHESVKFKNSKRQSRTRSLTISFLKNQAREIPAPRHKKTVQPIPETFHHGLTLQETNILGFLETQPPERFPILRRLSTTPVRPPPPVKKSVEASEHPPLHQPRNPRKKVESGESLEEKRKRRNQHKHLAKAIESVTAPILTAQQSFRDLLNIGERNRNRDDGNDSSSDDSALAGGHHHGKPKKKDQPDTHRTDGHRKHSQGHMAEAWENDEDKSYRKETHSTFTRRRNKVDIPSIAKLPPVHHNFTNDFLRGEQRSARVGSKDFDTTFEFKGPFSARTHREMPKGNPYAGDIRQFHLFHKPKPPKEIEPVEEESPESDQKHVMMFGAVMFDTSQLKGRQPRRHA